MLKKDAGVDLRTGTSSIIIDKFVELTGTAVFGIIGLILLLYIPGGSSLKIILALLLAFTFSVLFLVYYRTISGKGSFSSLFSIFKLHKIARFRNLADALEDIERNMEKFFKNHRKEFLISFLAYALYGIAIVLDVKFIMLSLGFNLPLPSIILILVVIGIANFIPVPAGLGFLEAGQSSLLQLLKGQGSIGLALSLLSRFKDLLFVAFGFSLISHFSGRVIEKKIKKSF